MNILAFDTVSSSFSIALQKDDNTISELNKQNIKNHNEEILPALQSFLKENNVSLDDITYIALGMGPGSFTALRIAFATIKTICYAKNIPIIGIQSLDALYENIKDYDGIKAAMIDARKGSVYANIYNGCNKLKENMDLTYQEFIDIINSIENTYKNIVLCGDGFYNNRDFFTENLKNYNIKPLDENYNIIRAYNIILLSKYKFKNNLFDDIHSLLPLYIRKSEAENKKK